MRLHEGDRVTVRPVDDDPIVLNFQRYVTIARPVDGGYMVSLEMVYPPGAEFGPIPAERLQPGWKDNLGRWR